ncbi:MAG: carbohydrate ABC transporter permease [Planctomycetota bacterium]|jgi:ABC-type glycerol-3-phosphate transport system permease component
MTRWLRPHWSIRLLVHAIVYGGAMLMLLPLAWIVSTSLKSHARSLDANPSLLPAGWPADWHWSNYAAAWQAADFDRFYGNSLIVAIVVTVLSVAHNALAGYAFAKIRFRGRRITFALAMATLLLPYQVWFIFAYVFCGRLGYVDQLQALIVPFLASAFGIFYMRQSMQSVPDGLLDAGRLDGLGDADLAWHIALPLARPALAALAIFTFMASWNNFFWPLIVIDSTDRFTLPLAVNRLTSDYFTASPPVRMAAAVMLIVPTVIVYLLFERSFVKGMTLTGLKE